MMRHSYEQLRAVIPPRQPEKSSNLVRSNSESYAKSIPLEICLSQKNRNLLESGAVEGTRNNSGAALARDLIGAANYLISIGQLFEGDPYTLFKQFGQRCQPDLPKEEVESIWRSAEKDNPDATLSPQCIEGCIRGFISREQQHNIQTRAKGFGKEKSQGKNQRNPPAKNLTTADLVAGIQACEEIENPVEKWEAWEKIKDDSGKTHRALTELARAIKIKVELSDHDWAISAKEFGSYNLGAKEWLLAGLLPANRSTLFVAAPKTGKSLLVYDLAYRLATGQNFGEFSCDRPRKVLIVQTDESEIECQERVNTRGLNELENVRIIRQFTPNLMARLKRVATDWGAEVIIFDSLTSIQRHSGYSPKDPEYGYWLYDLKDFASEHRITPIMIAHTNKAPIEMGLEKVAGSYAITAAVSEIFMLTRPAKPVDECDRVLIRVASRSAGQSAWLLELNLEDFSWEYKFPCQRDGNPLEDDSSFAPNDKLNCRENVLKFLAHKNGQAFEAKAIANSLNFSYNNVRKVCADLYSERMITRVRSGKPWVYACQLPFAPFTNSSSDRQLPTHSVEASEKKPEKTGVTDHYSPQSLTPRGLQVDHVSDPLVIQGLAELYPSDLPLEDQAKAKPIELLGGYNDA